MNIYAIKKSNIVLYIHSLRLLPHHTFQQKIQLIRLFDFGNMNCMLLLKCTLFVKLRKERKNSNKLSSSSDKPQFWLGFKLMLTDSIQEWVGAYPEILVKIGLLI